LTDAFPNAILSRFESMKNDRSNNIWDSYWGSEEDHAWWKRPTREVLEFIASQSPEERPNVLDLGCGLGRHAIAFAQAGFSVTATDASECAVGHLRKWAEELSLPIQTQVCDVLGDSFAKASFDIVLSYNVIYRWLSGSVCRCDWPRPFAPAYRRPLLFHLPESRRWEIWLWQRARTAYL